MTSCYVSGEKLEREEVDILIKECCDPEDDDGFIPYERKSILKYREGQTDGIPSAVVSAQPDIYSSSFPEAGVCGPPPRDVRGLVKKTPTTELDQQPVRAAQQLSVKTTFNYQLQLAVSTTTRTRRQNYQNHQKRCGPKSPLANF